MMSLNLNPRILRVSRRNVLGHGYLGAKIDDCFTKSNFNFTTFLSTNLWDPGKVNATTQGSRYYLNRLYYHDGWHFPLWSSANEPSLSLLFTRWKHFDIFTDFAVIGVRKLDFMNRSEYIIAAANIQVVHDCYRDAQIGAIKVRIIIFFQSLFGPDEDPRF
jgi:hypothetical protein